MLDTLTVPAAKTISTQWRDAGTILAGFCRKHGPAHAKPLPT